MLAQISNRGIPGTDAYSARVDADAGEGLSACIIVGFPNNAIKESQKRVCPAVKNTGVASKPRRMTIPLSPNITTKYLSRYLQLSGRSASGKQAFAARKERVARRQPKLPDPPETRGRDRISSTRLNQQKRPPGCFLAKTRRRASLVISFIEMTKDDGKYHVIQNLQLRLKRHRFLFSHDRSRLFARPAGNDHCRAPRQRAQGKQRTGPRGH